jgi:hypothetical protein
VKLICTQKSAVTTQKPMRKVRAAWGALRLFMAVTLSGA